MLTPFSRCPLSWILGVSGLIPLSSRCLVYCFKTSKHILVYEGLHVTALEKQTVLYAFHILCVVLVYLLFKRRFMLFYLSFYRETFLYWVCYTISELYVTFFYVISYWCIFSQLKFMICVVVVIYIYTTLKWLKWQVFLDCVDQCNRSAKLRIVFLWNPDYCMKQLIRYII